VVGVAALGIGSVATPALADADGGSPSAGGVIECTSGIVTDGEVSMSALTVTRTPTTLPTSPGDCSEG
jgi:hypothetical protein